LINGNVTSDYVTNPKPNPTGYPTRIVAGEVLEDRAPGRDPQGGFPQGTFTSAGNIDNFQITGSLIDSVLAASVAPYGGNGTLPFAYGFMYSAPTPPAPTPGGQGFNTCDAPAGFIIGGTAFVSSSKMATQAVSFPNFSEVSYYNETEINAIIPPSPPSTVITVTFPFPRRSLYTTASPDNTILPGAINPSFATAPADLNATNATPVTGTVTTTAITLSLPSKSTVLGGVISNPHTGPEANDFAGIFADDTRGVFVGVLPTSS